MIIVKTSNGAAFFHEKSATFHTYDRKNRIFLAHTKYGDKKVEDVERVLYGKDAESYDGATFEVAHLHALVHKLERLYQAARQHVHILDSSVIELSRYLDNISHALEEGSMETAMREVRTYNDRRQLLKENIEKSLCDIEIAKQKVEETAREQVNMDDEKSASFYRKIESLNREKNQYLKEYRECYRENLDLKEKNRDLMNRNLWQRILNRSV